jgi:hypothetical protein
MEIDCPQSHGASDDIVIHPVSFDSDTTAPGSGRFANIPAQPEEKESQCFDCFLSSTPMHPVDSDDDCSVISALSFNDMSADQDDEGLYCVPLNNSQDSIQTNRHDHYQQFESATIVSSPYNIHFADSQEDAMSTTSSLLDDIMSLGDDQLDSCSNDSIFRNDTCHFDRLPNELICSIASYLDVESLARTRLVNKRLLPIASQDDAGWKEHCKSLWSRKVNISKDAYSLLQNGNARKAFYAASREAVSRHHVFREELCFNPTTKEGIIWSFRFKATAGADWTSWDPWWTGNNNAREMVFLADGRVMQYNRGNKDNEEDRLVLPFYNAETRPGGLEVRWRFISQPMDLPRRPEGAYLRLTIAGRDVPTYVVHRSPTGNWGFVMESCWGVYSSFPLARRKQVRRTDAIERPPRMRLRRTTHGEARWLNVAEMESDDEAEHDADDDSLTTETPNSLEDSALSVTTAWQWREAILHNQGLVTLPEGESAAAEFDRLFWGQRLRRGTSVAL